MASAVVLLLNQYFGAMVVKENGKMSVSVVDSAFQAAMPCLEGVGNVFVLPRLSGSKGEIQIDTYLLMGRQNSLYRK